MCTFIYTSLKLNKYSSHPKDLLQMIKYFQTVGCEKARLQLLQCDFAKEREGIIAFPDPHTHAHGRKGLQGTS